jgi:serine protease Do
MKRVGLMLFTAVVVTSTAWGKEKPIEKRDTRGTVSTASLRVEPDFEMAAAAITPAVVYIRTTYGANEVNGEGQDNDMPGQQMGPQNVQMASGSGVIISPDGYIVTNNHVVENAAKIEITTNDHRNFIAKVIGRDPNTDLAVIKIEANGLPVAIMGNSDEVRVGEWVLAVGNPFNLTSTVTAGIVSAKGRGIGIIGSENRNQENPAGEDNEPVSQRYNTGIESFIQTDAAINPGNSGGALVNTKGELIGINSAIASHTGSYEGYGFAIPINLAKKVVGDIEKYGSVKRGYVGVSFRELNQDAAQDLHIQATTGLYVNSVIPGSGAALAGIQNGDIITKVDGKPVYESSDLLEPVGRLQPGDKIDLTVMRGSQEKNFPVTLEATEGNLNRMASYSSSHPELFDRLGASFQPLTQAQKDKLQVNSGVKVTGVIQGRLFDSLQIPAGSVIVSINKQDVNSVEDIRKAINDNQNGRLVIKGYDPDGTPFNNLFEQNEQQ